MDIVKVGWSGGKDSTASVLLHLENGDKVKAVCYVPMFTKDIPLITKEHYDFIVNTAERLRKMGAEVHIISGVTYWDYVTKITTRGKYQGKMRGFPCVIAGKCGFRRDSKVKAVSNFDVGDYDYLDIGIAYDETERHSQLSAEKRSILVEKKITEDMARKMCIDIGMYSPHYNKSKRDGCVLCPNAKKLERLQWYQDYPEAYNLVLELQEKVREQYPDRQPLRKCKWFIDTDQVDIFGNYAIN